MRLHPRLFLIFSACAALAACNGASDSDPQVPARLDVVAGDAQAGLPSTELAQPLVVRVVDDKGKPVRGRVVNFRVTAGGGSVFAGTAETNADGEARERWTLGPSAADSQKVEARAVDPATGEPLVFATFRATFEGRNVPATIALTGSVPGLGGAPGRVVPDSLYVRVSDRYNLAASGVTVTWSATGGAQPSPATSVTGAGGVASTQVTVGAASGTITATTGPGLTVQAPVTTQVAARLSQTFFFAVDMTPFPAPATALDSTWLGVRVTDANSVPVVGATVTYAVTAGGGTLSRTQSVTNQDGRAYTVLATGPQAGLNQVTAASGAATPITIGYTTVARVVLGSVRTLPDTLRLSPGAVGLVDASALDTGGGMISEAYSASPQTMANVAFLWQNRIPGVVSLDSSVGFGNNNFTQAGIRALAPGQGWVVATLAELPFWVTASAQINTYKDSTYVIVQ
jgi:hypothetical protein